MPSQKEKTNNFVNPETGRISITEAFGKSLAVILSRKILEVYKEFDDKSFVNAVSHKVKGKNYTQRVEIIADLLKEFLPEKYEEAIRVLMGILGPENPKETGMFKEFYWLMPVGKFVEKYGLKNFKVSIKALEEITKRNTGEYAIRPYARMYPQKTLEVCKRWARSKNFHLRRLASEGLRPKLPWASKLDVWNENPKPIFELLKIMKEDEVKFVKKSVANHLRDWSKVNPKETARLVKDWSETNNEHTKWILRHMSRK